MQINCAWDEGEKKRFFDALRRVEKSAKYQIESPGNLIRMLAIKFTEEVRIAIVTRKWVSKWGVRGQQYYQPYAKWKEEKVGHLQFWKLFGDLLYNLQHFEVAEGWFSGIPSTIMDKGGKSFKGGRAKPIAMYGTILEEGGNFASGGKHPARPVFLHTLNAFAYAKTIESSGIAWKICDQALVKIGDAWR